MSKLEEDCGRAADDIAGCSGRRSIRVDKGAPLFVAANMDLVANRG